MSIIVVLIGASFLVLSASYGVRWVVSDMRQNYLDDVNSPYWSAYYSQTPEDYVANIQQMQQGIKNLGLDPDDYTTLLPWNQYEYYTIGAMTEYYDSLINRGEDTVTWKNDLYTNKTVSEITADLYEEKIDNLRYLMNDFRSVSYIKTAYQIKYASYYIYGIWYAWVGILLWFALGIYLVRKHSDYTDKIGWRNRDEVHFWHHNTYQSEPEPPNSNIWES